MNFGQCADLGVEDGDRMVTILNRLVTWSNQIGIEAVPRHRDILLVDEYGRIRHICTVPCDGCEMQTGTSRNLIVRTNWEFERYVNNEILEFIFFVNAWFDTVWMCTGIKVPTMVESDACLEEEF